jgi:hypothetical protein
MENKTSEPTFTIPAENVHKRAAETMSVSTLDLEN